MTGRRLAVLTVLLGALTATATAASAAHPDQQIVLPGATSAEGIAKGVGSTFYAGDLFRRRHLPRGPAAPHRRVVHRCAAPVAWRWAWPSTCDTGLLFVAGGFDGTAHVYDTNTGATVATYQFTDSPSVINDVAITRKGAWFTDSCAGQALSSSR